MSQLNISRALLNSLLPEGPIVTPKIDGDLDKFLDGISLGIENTKLFLKKLADIRNPYNTSILSDLEKEYGIITKDNISEEIRIMQLATKIYETAGTGSKDNLENALQRAGFDVLVHSNSPAVDPAIFLDQAFQLVCGDPLNAFAGDPNAYCGRVGGYLLVNGAIFTRRPNYLSIGDPLNAFAGDPICMTGYFLSLIKEVKEYEIPDDPDTWPFIFFVGGPATRGGSGELTDIETADVPSERRQEFENIILSYKPIFTWAGLIINYT